MATDPPIRERNGDGFDVEVNESEGGLVIQAWTDGGGCSTQVYLADILRWAAANQLEMVREALHKEGYYVS